MAELANQFATYPSLRDRLVFVTGGATGIGASFVEHFTQQGARVFFCDLAEAEGQALCSRLRQADHAPVFLPCDVTDTARLRALIIELVRQQGSVRVLINNAASDNRHDFSEVTPEFWDERMAINLKHQFFAAQAVAPGMKSAGGGSIINMSSISWLVPSPRLFLYNMAKAAIVAMTRALAHELGPDNIRVNCVLPGAVVTERQKRLWRTEEYNAQLMTRQSLKRELLPSDVARLVLFLASDDSAMISNQQHIIDGGWM